jgi:hypothetical protein
MTHSATTDWWIVSAIAVSIVVLLLGANYWIVGPLLLNLMICAYPQTYQTTEKGLVVRTALGRQLIPYQAITSIGLASGNPGRVCVRYGPRYELRIAPADLEGFFTDMAARTPHLSGQMQSCGTTRRRRRPSGWWSTFTGGRIG